RGAARGTLRAVFRSSAACACRLAVASTALVVAVLGACAPSTGGGSRPMQLSTGEFGPEPPNDRPPDPSLPGLPPMGHDPRLIWVGVRSGTPIPHWPMFRHDPWRTGRND